jgi:protein-disulfide isomerase
MTVSGPDDTRPAKNRRRDAARVKAAALRVEQKKQDRLRQFFLRGGIGVAAIAVVAVVAFVIMTSVRPDGPGPSNMASDGILIGQGMAVVETSALQPDAAPVPSVPDPTGSIADIRIYVDYLCPLCAEFETTNGEQIAKWVETNGATVEIHPIAILTSKSAGTKYSLRAANSAACVANYAPESFYAFNTVLFENQPEEGTAGLTDDEIKELVVEAGVSSALPAINACIDDTMFSSWVTLATDRALSGPLPNSDVPAVTRAPTVLVNGKQYVGSLSDPKEFASFVLLAAGETYSTSTPTPTPSAAG